MTPARRPLETLDFAVLQQCMHCGLCLPSCPTYAETGRERNSPRGRIALMRAVAEKELPVTPSFAEEMDYCLGCLACTTACPAGVDYGTLIEAARETANRHLSSRNWRDKALRWFFLRRVFRHPSLLRFLARLLRLYQRGHYKLFFQKHILPWAVTARWRTLEKQAPPVSPRFSNDLIAPRETPSRRRYRVALLTGCVQDVLFAEVNRATADVLLANDCEVITPAGQSCCGSLHAHNGDLATARELACRMLDSIEVGALDAIITNAAGCGSHLKHYRALLADDPAYRDRAAEWDLKIRDVSEFLVEIGFRKPTAAPFTQSPTAITYHDACHLCHGQGITRQPREILQSLPGIELRECHESTWCCGSAGIYALTQPDTANRLRERKWKNLSQTGAKWVAMGNPGCALHLAAREGESIKAAIVHPVVLLARAYAAESRA